MNNLYISKISCFFNALSFTGGKIDYLCSLIEKILYEFKIKSGCLYKSENGSYRICNSWNIKLKIPPVFHPNENFFLKISEENIYFLKSISEISDSFRENLIEIPENSLKICFAIKDNQPVNYFIFFGNHILGKALTNDEIIVIKELFQETEKIFSDFEEIKNILINQKLSILSPILSLISHDARNPVQAISIISEILQAKELPLEKRLVLQTRINEALEQITNIVSEASDFTKDNYNFDFELTPCGDFLNEIQGKFAGSLKKIKIELEFNMETNEYILIDKQNFKNVILKLLKYSRDRIQFDGLISLSIFKDEEKVIITIQDTGEEISPEYLEHIFDPFYTFGNKKGIGLSFAIIKKTIEAHHGSYEIYSQKEEGTKHIITLPAVRQ